MNLLKRTGLLAALLFSIHTTSAAPRAPWAPWPEQTTAIFGWDEGSWYVPWKPRAVGFESARVVESWSGYALLRDSTDTVPVVIPPMDGTRQPNFSGNYGAIRFWFSPNWSSAEKRNKKDGPGQFARLLELVNVGATEPQTRWSLYVDEAGQTMYFSGLGLGAPVDYLTASIALEAGQWVMVTLCYGPDTSELWFNGEQVASGLGVPVPPRWEAQSLALVVGSDVTADNAAGGLFEQVTAFDYWPDAQQQQFYFNGVSRQVWLGPVGTPEEEAAKQEELNSMLIQSGMMGMEEDGGGVIMAAYCYSSNELWLEITGVTNDIAYLTLHNTEPEVMYELLSREVLADTNWITEGYVIGADEQDWTPTTIVTLDRTNLFVWALSWRDGDGDGLPDWWELENGLDAGNPDTGNTGVSDGYKDGDNDGWTNLQEYENGTSPTSFNIPPTPKAVTARLDSTGTNVVLTWESGGGPVQQYTIEYSGVYPPEVGVVSSSTFEFTHSSNFQFFGNPFAPPAYRVRADYAGGGSSWSEWLYVHQAQLSFNAAIVRGAGGIPLLMMSPPPEPSTAVRVFAYAAGYPWVEIYGSNFMNGIASAPEEFLGQYKEAYVQARSADNEIGPRQIAGPRLAETAWPPDQYSFVDAAPHLRENLRFLLRSASVTRPFSYGTVSGSSQHGTLDPYSYFARGASPSSHEYSGYWIFNPSWGYAFMPELRPIQEHYLWRNFVFDSGDFVNGSWQTGADYNASFPIRTLSSPLYEFTGTASNSPPAPLAFTSGGSTWLYFGKASSNDAPALAERGLYINGSGELVLAANARNVHGLFINSVHYWDVVSASFVTLTAGGPGIFPNQQTTHYFGAVEEPQLETVDYLFTSQSPYFNYFDHLEPLPGSPDFSPTNAAPLLIAPAGQTFTVSGWAKQRIVNGYTNVFAYLEQYFDKAYSIDANGAVTTNETGILSPYGEFFSTEPGPTALVTMPDLDTGERGTGVVHVIKLQLDVNHDGVMDTSFTGPDNTSADRPFVFWVNNDHDTFSGKDLNSPNIRNHDNNVIDGVRDLEDFARLWLAGLPPLPGLSGYEVTLSWRNTTGTPTIKIYEHCQSSGGIAYLTDLQEATSQVQYVENGGFLSGCGAALGTVGLGAFTFSQFQMPSSPNQYLLFEGAGIGSGELVLTISQDSQVLAQTSAWIELRDVKELYERANVETVTSTGPPSDWTSTVRVENPFAGELGGDTNVVVFVHGINNTTPDWLISSATTYKRLYWSGYQGRFASVRWPCKYLPPNSVHPFDFNLSEFYGYKSAIGLKTYLEGLRGRFPTYSLHVVAHSQGAAVASEAVSMGASLETLILTQAAMPASSYDIAAPTVGDLLTVEVSEPTPEWKPMGYRGAHTNIAGRVVNFFNPDDYALGVWVVNQKLSKPDGLPGARNYTSDGTNGYAIIDIDLYRLVTDPQECRGMVARSRTLALGAQGPASGQTTQGIVGETVDLKTQFGFSDTRPEHSAQFTRPLQTVRPYYQQLLRSCQLQPAP